MPGWHASQAILPSLPKEAVGVPRVKAPRRRFTGIAPLASNASKARKISVDGFASLWEVRRL